MFDPSSQKCVRVFLCVCARTPDTNQPATVQPSSPPTCLPSMWIILRFRCQETCNSKTYNPNVCVRYCSCFSAHFKSTDIINKQRYKPITMQQAIHITPYNNKESCSLVLSFQCLLLKKCLTY